MMRLKSIEYVSNQIGIPEDDLLSWCSRKGVSRFFDGTRWLIDFDKASSIAGEVVKRDEEAALETWRALCSLGPVSSKRLAHFMVRKHVEVLRSLGHLEQDGRAAMVDGGCETSYGKGAVATEMVWVGLNCEPQGTKPPSATAMPPVPTKSRAQQRWEMIEDEMILTSTLSHGALSKIMGRTAKAIGSRRASYRRGVLVKTW